jgi:hypothetical protein
MWLGFGIKRSTAHGIEPGHLACSLLHFVVHVLGPSGAIGTGSVPKADEPRVIDTPCERRVEQPEIAALERIDSGR